MLTVYNSPPRLPAVIPAQAGIQGSGGTFRRYGFFLDSRLRGNDGGAGA